MLVTTAAAIFSLVVAGVISFQVALALGAPWGAFAMGGTFPGRYPIRMRLLAAAQAVLLAVIALIVLSKAGVILPNLSEAIPSLIWLVVVFSAVSVVLNAITRSAGERRIWLPVALVMLITSLVVALGD